ncbi:MAG: RNA-binding protein [Planctomycetaceae bacterium]|nr:RNA-binding protein [Planctomycetaceae bacterium]
MTQIFVGNLAYTTSERELRSLFERFGRVSSIRLATDRQSGNPRGFAFVLMPSWDDADEAITRLNGSSQAGRSIVVREAESESNRPESRPKTNPFLDLL